MKNLHKRIIAVVCLISMFAFVGCSKDTNYSETEYMTEIDVFVTSVLSVKNEYDENYMTKATVENATNDAMFINGFLAESPDLLQDTEYAYKITEAYNALNGIDLNKENLKKEEFSSQYAQLNSIVTSLYNKIDK